MRLRPIEVRTTFAILVGSYMIERFRDDEMTFRRS